MQGFCAGTAEISVTHNFGVRLAVRKTTVNRTAKKWPFGAKKY